MEELVRKNQKPERKEVNELEKSSQLSAKEVNGRKGLEPTRYGDWEKNGRCIDF